MSQQPIDHSRWMEQLAPRIARKTLRQVVLPGSHDAGTASISSDSAFSPDAPGFTHIFPKPLIGSTIAAWSRAQGQHLGEQLQAGIRYFDLRPAKNGADGKLYYAHSMFGDNVLDSIGQISGFLQAHPQEVVILDFQSFLDLTANDLASLSQAIEAAFADKLVPPPPSGTMPTLEAIWSNQQQVVVIYTEESGGAAALAAHPNFWSRKLLTSKWAGTDDPVKLREFLRSFVKWAPSKHLFVLQGVLTPDSGTIKHGLFGKPSSLHELAQIGNPQVMSWCLTEWAKKGLNIIMVDWAVDSGVVDVAIRLNS